MSYYVHAYLVDANKVKAVYGSHDMDLLNQLSSSLKEKLDSLNNYFESEISFAPPWIGGVFYNFK